MGDRKTITLPSSKKVVELKTYITGRDSRAINSVLNGGFDVDSKTGVVSGISLEIQEQFENKAVELIVVSIDGKTEKIVELYLDLRAQDFNFLNAEVEKVRKGDEDKKK